MMTHLMTTTIGVITQLELMSWHLRWTDFDWDAGLDKDNVTKF